MRKQSPLALAYCLLGTASLCGGKAAAQQPIGYISATEVRVSGAVEVDRGQMLLGNGSTITAASQPVKITLNRGGDLLLCSTTSLHLAADRSAASSQDTALMMALDRGALEAHYTVAKYSDVLLTPDLRILISGPGEADLSVRVNAQGDTCVDNHGAGAPYVTVSNQLEGGVYRVQPNQRVEFEHGTITSVIDREPEPCGCPTPPAVSVANAGTSSKSPAHAGQPVGGPSSTAADTAFPVAESEGLASPPPPPTTPVVPVGQAHAEVTVPLTYNGENPSQLPPAVSPAAATPTTASTATTATTATSGPNTAAVPAQRTAEQVQPAAEEAQPPAAPKSQQTGLFHRIGHFFSRIFQ